MGTLSPRLLLHAFAVTALLAGCHPRAISATHGLDRGAPKVRNTILLIGDGMGFGALGLLELHERHTPGTRSALLELVRSAEVGIALTSPHSALVTESACSATELATGERGRPEAVGIGESGAPLETIVEKARRAGKWTGLVSDTRITHATPAAFAAHRPHRTDENGIAEDLLRTRVEVLFSGGLRHFIPHAARAVPGEELGWTPSSTRIDDRDLLGEAKALGYGFAFSRTQLDRLSHVPAIGLFANSAMHDAFSEAAATEDAGHAQPSLREMTEKALSLLAPSPHGFFLMVEAGQIDWAGHQNDAGRLLAEMRRFDRATRAVLDWAASRDDTLVVLTADHETGSFGLSYSAYGVPERYAHQRAQRGVDETPVRFNFLSADQIAALARQKRPLNEVRSSFYKLPKESQTPEALRRLVLDATGFELTPAQCERILLRGPNRFHIAGHDELGPEEGPLMDERAAYYPDIAENLAPLIARALSEQQGTVWGTGTHTAEPVIVAAAGPEEARRRFNGMHTQAEIGRLLQQSLGLE